MRGLVARQLGRALERHVTAERAAGGGNVVSVGGENETIECARVARRFDRVHDQRLAGERLQVLAGQALRSAAGRDHAEDVTGIVASGYLVVWSFENPEDQSLPNNQMTR